MFSSIKETNPLIELFSRLSTKHDLELKPPYRFCNGYVVHILNRRYILFHLDISNPTLKPPNENVQDLLTTLIAWAISYLLQTTLIALSHILSTTYHPIHDVSYSISIWITESFVWCAKGVPICSDSCILNFSKYLCWDRLSIQQFDPSIYPSLIFALRDSKFNFSLSFSNSILYWMDIKISFTHNNKNNTGSFMLCLVE